MRASLLVAFLLALTHSNVQAWDQHHFLTDRTLEGIQSRDPHLWRTLNTPITVNSIERFMHKAFGGSCNWAGYSNGVLEGVGRKYSVQYTEGAIAQLKFIWETGSSFAQYRFLSDNSSSRSQAPGNSVLPRQVLSIYSDEPDWGMDDDVPQLKSKGVAKEIEGMGTRILRHFWYEGEENFGVNMNKDQELDRRFQLLYELSQVAFSVEEPYWGYRFLGNALHYLQDITQPFHVKGVINDDMIYKFDFIRAQLCTATHSNPRCTPQDTILNATIKTGWLIATYHSIYEDFARGLLATDYHHSSTYVADTSGAQERFHPVASLRFSRDSRGLLNLLSVVRQIQAEIVPQATDVAAQVYSLFGNRYRYSVEDEHQELLLGGLDASVGYRMAEGDFYAFPLSEKEQNSKNDLLESTHRLLQQAATWSRDFVSEALRPQKAQTEAQLLLIRLKMAKNCSIAAQE